MASEGGMQPFRHIIRDRLLIEMLRGTKSGPNPAADWKVLIMDDYTIKVMSTTCKMADITEEGVSLVEDLSKKRQPLPLLDAVYFIQPSSRSVHRLVEDMGGPKALYKKAYIFFSSPVGKDTLQVVKENAQLRSRIAALKEMNLEISTVDKQGFVTDQEKALVDLFGGDNHHYERCIDHMASRLATVFASLKEFPVVRYRAAKTSSTEAGTPERARDLVPTKLAAGLWDRLLKYKQNLHGFPHHDTCDLLIVDRSVDPVAPVIHDWSYGGMAFDLLPMDGNKYDLQITTESGKVEHKIVILEEHDNVWVDLRDLFIAEALEKVTKLSDEIVSKQTSQKAELSAKEMQALIASLGKYREQKDKVDLHVSIAQSLMQKVQEEGLMGLSKLEQGFVFGDSAATYKELANHLNTQELSVESKVRLLAVYAATHPERYTPDKRALWMKMAKLTSAEIAAVNNLDHIGVSSTKEAQSKTLSFKGKGKGSFRQERSGKDGGWELMRFYPLVQDLVEDLHRGQLDREAFPFVQEPHHSHGPPPPGASASVRSRGPAVSMRSAGGSGSGSGSGSGGWASRRTTASAGAGDKDGSSGRDLVAKGRRLFVFIVGGMMRSELRVAHVMTRELNREVIIGSSSVETPARFLERLRQLEADN